MGEVETMIDKLSDDGAILFEVIDEHIALVTLNRPEKRNAINNAITTGLGRAVKLVDQNPDLRVAILASSSETMFCAGADLALVEAGASETLHTDEGGFAGFVFYPRIKPWIAAASGVTMAGGLELCLACDLIVGDENSRFSLPEVKRSLIAGGGGTSRLPRVIPKAIALEMLLTGDAIDAHRAHSFGLINRVAPAGQAVKEALNLARAIIANAPLAVQESLRLGRAATFMTDEQSCAMAVEALEKLYLTDDFKEGPRAFLEKRPPAWTSR